MPSRDFQDQPLAEYTADGANLTGEDSIGVRDTRNASAKRPHRHLVCSAANFTGAAMQGRQHYIQA